MGEFFKGWRRKVGCITLVMAAAITGAEIRSGFVCDEVYFRLLGRDHCILSAGGTFSWWAWNQDDLPLYLIKSFPFRHHAETQIFFPIQKFRRYEFREFSGLVEWTILYWIPALTLVLLSAYLILWRGRRPSVTSPRPEDA